MHDNTPFVAESDAAPVAVAKPVASLPEGAVWQPDGSVLVTLLEPVTLGLRQGDADRSEVISSITCRKFLAGVMIDAGDQPSASTRTLFLMQAMTGLPGPKGAQILRGLEPADYVTLSEVLAVFTGSGRRTGR